MKVLILGASGQVGSEIAPAFARATKSNLRELEVILATRADVDVADFDALLRFTTACNPDWIINATAYTAVDDAETDQELARLINTLVPKLLAEICSTFGIKLLHLSTDYVFSGTGDFPFSETDQPAPLGVYGETKLSGEVAIRQEMTEYIVLRTSWVFGVRGANFVKIMIDLASTRNFISVVSDQIGAPTSARAISNTVAKIIDLMACADQDDSRWGVYHFSGAPFVSWAQFAEEVFSLAIQTKLLNKKPVVIPIKSADYPTVAKRPENSRLSSEMIKQVFDIDPDNWRDSLALMLTDLKDRSL